MWPLMTRNVRLSSVDPEDCIGLLARGSSSQELLKKVLAPVMKVKNIPEDTIQLGKTKVLGNSRANVV